MSKIKVGLIGLVHEEAERDFWGTMQHVAAIGYRGIESPGFLLDGDAAASVQRFRALGLEIIATPTSREGLRDNLDSVIRNAHTLGTKYVLNYWGPAESRDQLLRDAELYNRAGARLAGEGLQLCYHNHEHEFKTRFNGVYALDILAEHTDPHNMAFEIDIAWTTFGGEDPAQVLRRFAGRVPIIHVKDLWSLHERDLFTTVGTGVVNIREAVLTAIDTGVEWAVVEQDKLRNLDAFQTITASYWNLKEQGLV